MLQFDAAKSARRTPLALVLLTGLFCCVCIPASLSAKARPAAAPVFDANYTSALAVADRFLQAWQGQNQEDGLLLLSDAAKAHTTEEGLQAFFEHKAAAYEIERGRTLKDGRYVFPVVLFGMAPGAGSRSRPHVAQIIVARTGSREWAIDRLP